MTGPDFVIAGAPKCGTTSLYAYLAPHPDIFLSPVKEPNYYCFDAPGIRFVDSAAAYARLFAPALPGQLRGEASTSYLFSRIAVPELLKANPAAKIVVMVRNPLDMVLSYHAQKVYTLDENEPDFEAAWRLSEVRRRGERAGRYCRAVHYLDYKAIGRLGRQVKNLQEIVPPSQLHLILFDDLEAAPAGVYCEVVRFLGIRPGDRRDFTVANARKVHAWPALARMMMRPPAPLRRAKMALKRAFPAQSQRLGAAIHGLNQRPEKRTRPSNALRQEVIEEFRDDVAVLEHLLDRDLSHWCADADETVLSNARVKFRRVVFRPRRR